MILVLIRNNGTPAPVETIIPVQVSQADPSLQNQMLALTEQLKQVSAVLIQTDKNSQTQPTEIIGDNFLLDSEQEARAADKLPVPSSVAKPPQVLLVQPTPAQQENYEALKAKLDDVTFISTLNMQEFSSSPEVQSLPKPLQMVLLSKIIEQYSRGYISEKTFLGAELTQPQ